MNLVHSGVTWSHKDHSCVEGTGVPWRAVGAELFESLSEDLTYTDCTVFQGLGQTPSQG